MFAVTIRSSYFKCSRIIPAKILETTFTMYTNIWKWCDSIFHRIQISALKFIFRHSCHLCSPHKCLLFQISPEMTYLTTWVMCIKKFAGCPIDNPESHCMFSKLQSWLPSMIIAFPYVICVSVIALKENRKTLFSLTRLQCYFVIQWQKSSSFGNSWQP